MEMEGPLIEWLAENADAGDALVYGLIALAVWCVIWRLWIRDRLYECDSSSFGYAMYEFGPVGTFGLFIMFLVLLVLAITTVQAIPYYGFRGILTFAAFWIPVIAFFVVIFKKLKE